jgi:hypothetical protein
MAPFDGRPEGFSDVSLELLDQAMTEMWMRQVAIGAAMVRDAQASTRVQAPAKGLVADRA